MKNMVWVILGIIIAYLILQGIYTGYFFLKSESLVKATYTGKKDLGNPKNPEFKVFVDGDSVGAGVGASSFDKSIGGRIASFYAQKYHVVYFNSAVSGSQMATLADKQIPSDRKNLTVLVISSNDLFHFTDPSQFKDSTEKVIARYSNNTDKLIIIGPGRVFDAGAIPFFMKPVYKFQGPEYAQIISDEANKYPNVVYVNPQNAAVLRSDYGPTDASDGFHPNDEGHRFWYDLIKPYL